MLVRSGADIANFPFFAHLPRKIAILHRADIANFPFFAHIPRKITIFKPPRWPKIGPRWPELGPKCAQEPRNHNFQETCMCAGTGNATHLSLSGDEGCELQSWETSRRSESKSKGESTSQSHSRSRSKSSCLRQRMIATRKPQDRTNMGPRTAKMAPSRPRWSQEGPKMAAKMA